MDSAPRRTITDDLESHFYVLMWMALRWVEHNQPGHPDIKMEYIFDQQRPCAGRPIAGGQGKFMMYGYRNSIRGVEFSCKPFNDLFWDLWNLFAHYFLDRQWAMLKEKPGRWPSKLEL